LQVRAIECCLRQCLLNAACANVCRDKISGGNPDLLHVELQKEERAEVRDGWESRASQHTAVIDDLVKRCVCVCVCVCLVKRCKCVSEASSVDASFCDPRQPSLSYKCMRL